MRILIFTILIHMACFLSIKASEPINIVFIGNSITFGATLAGQDESAANRSVEALKAKGLDDIDFANCGVCGATTVDFLPATATLYNNAVAAARDLMSRHKGSLIFQISLGTNDSACSGPLGSPVLPQQYYTNLKVIIDDLSASFPGCRIVLQYPIWYSPNTYNGAVYLKAGLDRLKSYFPMLERLGREYADKNLTLGSTAAFDFFKDKIEYLTPEDGNAGIFYLHPNAAGAVRLGDFWAETIMKAVD